MTCDRTLFDRSIRGRRCPNAGRPVTVARPGKTLRFVRCQSHWPELGEAWTVTAG